MGEGSSPPPSPACPDVWVSAELMPVVIPCSPSSHSVDNMLTDQSDCSTPVKSYPIPAEIPESELDEFFLQIKSSFELRHTATLDRATRTISFYTKPNMKLMPGPALDKCGLPTLTTFAVPFTEKREKKVIDAWPEIELTLNAYSISCDLDLSNRCMHVYTTPLLKDPFRIEKARDLLQMLSESLVPPYMALEIFQGIRQQETINMGFQQGGMCYNYGINKDDYRKRWECLYRSLKALSKATHCHIFLDEYTVTAVGSSIEKISRLKAVVEDCITNNVCVATSIRRFGMEDDHHPPAKHKECLKFFPSWNKDRSFEVCSLYTFLHGNQVLKLGESMPMIWYSLRSYDISYNLDGNALVLSAIRGTKDPDIIDKAWQLLEILSATHVPASMAKELLDRMQTCFIKIGYQEGGLCSIYGIKEEEYWERWECLRHSLEILAEMVECNVFLNGNTVAALGETSVEMIESLVENCILHNVCPGTTARNCNRLSQPLKSIDDPHVRYTKMKNSGSAMRVNEFTSFCAYLTGEQATNLEKDWKIVEASLKKHDISCKVIRSAECCMVVSKTTIQGDPDITDKIWDFLELLSLDVEYSKAIGVLDGWLHCVFIPVGSKYGGITEEQYAEVVKPRILRGLKEMSSQMKYDYILCPNVIAVFGPTEDVRLVRSFVAQCFQLKRPAACIRARINGRDVSPIGREARTHFGLKPVVEA